MSARGIAVMGVLVFFWVCSPRFLRGCDASLAN